jgi:Tfp pilus assembly protein PilF
LNDQQQAKKAWEKALKIDPSLEEIRVGLRSLSLDKKGENP